MAGAPGRATLLTDPPKPAAPKQMASEKRVIPTASRIGRTSELIEEITPQMVADAIRGASSGNIGKLQGLYMRMAASDARFSGFLKALHAGLLANPLRVFPSKSKTPASREYAQIASDILFMNRHSDLIRRLAMPYMNGVVAYEPRWTVAKGRDGKDRVLPYELSVVPPTLYRMDMEKDSSTFGELMVVTEDDRDGVPVSEYPWGRVIVATDGTENGWLDFAGACRPCLFWFLAKTKNAAWWAEFNEVYGEPHRIAYFDENVGESELLEIEAFLKNVGRAAYALLPAELEIEVLNIEKAGTVKTYDDMIGLANNEMAIAILGQNQTSDGGKYGSFAKANVHMTVQHTIVKSIALMIKESLDELVLSTVAFNVGPNFDPADLPEIKLVVPNPEEKEVKARVFKMAQEIGLTIGKQHAQDELGIPEPDEEEEVLEPGHLQAQGSQEAEDGRDYESEDDSRDTPREEGDITKP